MCFYRLCPEPSHFLLQSSFLSYDPKYLSKKLPLPHFVTFFRFSFIFILAFAFNLKGTLLRNIEKMFV